MREYFYTIETTYLGDQIQIEKLKVRIHGHIIIFSREFEQSIMMLYIDGTNRQDIVIEDNDFRLTCLKYLEILDIAWELTK